MEYLASKIMDYVSPDALLEMALKGKSPSEIEKMLRPYNNIVKSKCGSCDNIVKSAISLSYRCDICHRNVCDKCTAFLCKECNSWACSRCVDDDICMEPEEVIKHMTKCRCH